MYTEAHRVKGGRYRSSNTPDRKMQKTIDVRNDKYGQTGKRSVIGSSARPQIDLAPLILSIHAVLSFVDYAKFARTTFLNSSR